jgi:hypothetical protein
VDLKCVDVSESDKSDNEISNTNLQRKLQAWAVDCKVTHSQLNKLLPILQEVDRSLPLNARTLLKMGHDMPLEVDEIVRW